MLKLQRFEEMLLEKCEKVEANATEARTTSWLPIVVQPPDCRLSLLLFNSISNNASISPFTLSQFTKNKYVQYLTAADANFWKYFNFVHGGSNVTVLGFWRQFIIPTVWGLTCLTWFVCLVLSLETHKLCFIFKHFLRNGETILWGSLTIRTCCFRPCILPSPHSKPNLQLD